MTRVPKPRKPLPRQQKPIRRSKIRKRARSKSERERIYGPKGYVEWIYGQPCAACGVVGYSECAHIKTGGMGRKDDWTQTIPLCGPHVNPGKQTITIGCHQMFDLKILALPESTPSELLAAETQKAWLVEQGERTE